jgi:hypothetical protein
MMNGFSVTVLRVLLLAVLAVPATVVAADTDRRIVNMVLDRSLGGPTASAERVVAWIAYSVSLASHIKENGSLASAPEGRYLPTYSEELHAREKQVQSWREILKSGKALNYPYMDEILAFADSGYFREYVWFAHYRKEWGKPDPTLRMHEFVRHNKDKFAGHQPQTLAWVEIKGSAVPAKE